MHGIQVLCSGAAMFILSELFQVRAVPPSTRGFKAAALNIPETKTLIASVLLPEPLKCG